MPPNHASSLRVHQFYVVLSKRLFLHPRYGIVHVRDPIRLPVAEEYDLKPILIYGLTVAGFPYRWVTFTSQDKPRSLIDVLQEAWRTAEGLRGLPDKIVISQNLATASPTLTTRLKELGIIVDVATAREKSLPAAMRATQEDCRNIDAPFGQKLDLPVSITKLCDLARQRHKSEIEYPAPSQREEERRQGWLNLPFRKFSPIENSGIDWRQGPWLSTWENNVPPAQPMTFHKAGSWMVFLHKSRIHPDPDDPHDTLYEAASALLRCWPNPLSDVAKTIGIKTQDLKWFMAGKAALPPRSRYLLMHILGVTVDESGYYESTAPCVIIGHDGKTLSNAYNFISSGGDASPFEILPDEGPGDPSWRYFIIDRMWGFAAIAMVYRGAPHLEKIPEILYNYAGIRKLPCLLYMAVVEACSRASRTPGANTAEIIKLQNNFTRDGVIFDVFEFDSPYNPGVRW